MIFKPYPRFETDCAAGMEPILLENRGRAEPSW